MDHHHEMGHQMKHNMDTGVHNQHEHIMDPSHHHFDPNTLFNESTTTGYGAADSIALSHEGHQGHGGHGSHGAHGAHSSGMAMPMTFHGGFEEVILFSWWNVTEVGEFIGSFFAIFIMALMYEGLKYYRKHLLWKTYTGLQYCAVATPDKGVTNACIPDEPQVIQPMPHTLERNIPTMMSTAHAWQTFLHGVQVLVSYMLMLVFMTYNTWLCAAVVLGSATGYFLFGWRESVVVDFTEHCH